MRKNFPNWSDFSEKLFSLFIRALHLFGHLFSLCCEDKWLFCSFSCPNHHFFAEQNCHLLPSWKGACLFHGFTTILRGRIFQFLLSQTWWTLLAQCFHYCKGSRSRLRFKSFPRIWRIWRPLSSSSTKSEPDCLFFAGFDGKLSSAFLFLEGSPFCFEFEIKQIPKIQGPQVVPPLWW